MKKHILIASTLLAGVFTSAFAQETEDAPKAKKEEKVIIKKFGKAKKAEKTTVIVDDDKVIVNGEPIEKLLDNDKVVKKEKRITVMVDGDNITVNGKPIDEMTDADIKVLRGNADHLGTISPFIHGTINGKNDDGSSFTGRFRVPQEDFFRENDNKALLGVTTGKSEKGATITSVSGESAAEKAGLKKGDIITKINSDKIETSDDLVKAIGKYQPEDKITVTYLRDNKSKTTEAVLGKNDVQIDRVFRWNDRNNFAEEMITPPAMETRPDVRAFYRINKPKMGIKIQDVEEGSGVKILEIDENTPASKSGLQKDDIITEINGDAIKSVDDLREKTNKAKEGDIYKIKYSRKGNIETTDLKFPKKLKTADL